MVNNHDIVVVSLENIYVDTITIVELSAETKKIGFIRKLKEIEIFPIVEDDENE